MDSDIMLWFLVLIIGIAVGAGIMSVALEFENIIIDQETADDICQQLTDNETAVAKETPDRKLICELPSYDAIQNIIIKTNSEE